MRSSLALAATAAVAVTGLAATPAAAAPSPDLVISQVYGGGGNSNATYTNDFVEIFNRGTSAASTNGMSIQYGSATGLMGAQASTLTALPDRTVPAGGYLLVQEASNAPVGAPLPAADVTPGSPIAMAAGAGKVALVRDQNPLGCGSAATPCSSDQLARVVDLVGYGTGSGGANLFEGSAPAPTASATASDQRADQGCQDTDQNGADFSQLAPPSARNSATALHVCGVDSPPTVTGFTPANGATGVDPGANVTVTFSEPVTGNGSWLTLWCGADQPLAVTGGPTTFTGNPSSDLPGTTACTATVHAVDVVDRDGTPDHPAADTSWSFTTAAPVPVVAIHDIQGASHRSPLVTQTVRTSGIVTATTAGKFRPATSNGFWMQDPSPDANDATSEGIFVFTSSVPTVSVGDLVQVTATVQEFRPSSSSGPNLSVTELSRPTISTISTGNPLPAPTVVGTGGRIPPANVIEDDATGNVETSGVFDPATDGLDFWESLEGMRVQLNDAVATGPTDTGFGETSIVGDDGAHATGRTNRGGVVISPDDFNPERVTLADNLIALPALNVGDHYDAPVVGVLDYNFGLYRLLATNPINRVDEGLQRETTATAAGDELSAATFNVENLDPNDGPEKFARLAHIVVDNMKSPDLISVEEVQDNNGSTNDGTVDASTTMQLLTQAIQAASGPAYSYQEIDPVDDQDGGEPGGNIRVVLMYRTDVGLSFVSRPGGTSTQGTTVVDGADGPQLSFSPGRIDPTNPAWDASRKPLAAEFMFRGRHLFAIGNHFNSKGGDDPLLGRFQPPTRSSEVQRHQQAALVHDFVSQILARDANADVVVMGDLNDFEFSDTVSILKGTQLHDLIDTLPKAERYSYDFEGNSQVLDQVLVSDHLFAAPAAVDVVHVNSEFFDQASDHDPTVVRLTMNSAPTVSAGGPYTVDEGSTLALQATGSDPEGDSVTYAWDVDGDGFDDGTGPTATFDASAIDGPATRTVRVQATDRYGASTIAETTVTIANVAPTITSVTPGAHAACEGTSSLTAAWTDPAPADTFTVHVVWGDGSSSDLPATASPLTASHHYARAGAHQVAVTVTDDDGGTSPTTWSSLVVDYSTAGLMAPWSNGSLTANAGSKVPLKAFVADCDGSHPSNLALTYEVTASAGGPVLKSGALRWDGAKYVANLDTSGLRTGAYSVTVTVASTGQTFGGTLRLR